ncbi:MAG: hypothetical protein OJF49_001720 [Ktedonobacterales bacterium]|nr:MAG: hypothetical protein OJF49_001720 [Ktedonobacterales bacterium]
MQRKLLSVVLLVAFAVSLVGCGGGGAASVVPPAVDAGFRLIDLVLNSDDIFVVAQDSILIAKDAVSLVQSIPANQSPKITSKPNHVTVSIHYVKHGVDTLDVYDVIAGKAKLGILLEGGITFESISANNVEIDATQTHQISIVPLQNAVSKVKISASKGWQNTGIFLERGKQFEVKYDSGLWKISNSVGTSDAAGQPSNAPPNLICNCGEPLPGFSTQGLVGRVGQGLAHAPLQVGDDFAGVAYDNDFLYLRINLADSLLHFASGTITVSVQTENGD